MENRKNIGGVALVALSAAAFGLMPIFAKMAYASGTGTYTLLFLRFLVAAVFMFLLMLMKKLPLPTKKEMLAFFLLGAVGYVGQSFCYFTALNYASSGTVSLLLYTYPALVMLGSAVVFKERITIKKAASLCLALVGAFVIIGTKLSAGAVGIILAVLAAVFYSVYILVSSRVVKDGQGIQSSAFIMLGATIVYGVINLFVGFQPPTAPAGYAAVLLIAFVSTVAAFWAFFTGMEITGPSVASLVSTLEPVVTVIASVVILSEPLTANLLVGGVLVLSSLVVTMLPGKTNKSNGESV